jgi:hypothetical protein
MSNHNDERICVVYFEDKHGHLIVAPDHRHPTPEGHERRECHTLHDIDLLTQRLNRQDRDQFYRMFQQDQQVMIENHKKIRARLGQRLLAVDCGPTERVFIERMYKYLDKKEAAVMDFKVRGYFHQREYDSERGPIDDYGRQLIMPKMSDRLASLLSK